MEKEELFSILETCDLTDFQKKVLRTTYSIPKGEVWTYKELAKAVGNPRAYRAVGTALKKNPLAPHIPCHRVVKSDGSLGSYSAPGGMRLKEEMLRREGAID